MHFQGRAAVQTVLVIEFRIHRGQPLRHNTMRKTLRKLFGGSRPKSALATSSPRTNQPNPNRASAPPAFGRVHSADDLTTYIVPGPLGNTTRCQTSTPQIQMTPEEAMIASRTTARASHFETAEHSLQANFPQARVVDAGQFPGNMELLDGVPKEDTRFFVAMNPEDSSQYIAVNLVIFSAGLDSPLGRTSPGVRPIVVAQDALAHLLRQWQRGGVSDGFLAVVSMGTESSVQIFRAKEGLVDLAA